LNFPGPLPPQSERPQDSAGEARIEGFTCGNRCLQRGMASKLIAYELNTCESTVKVAHPQHHKETEATTGHKSLTSSMVTKAQLGARALISIQAHLTGAATRLRKPKSPLGKAGDRQAVDADTGKETLITSGTSSLSVRNAASGSSLHSRMDVEPASRTARTSPPSTNSGAPSSASWSQRGSYSRRDRDRHQNDAPLWALPGAQRLAPALTRGDVLVLDHLGAH
jgi:hypothetical protein